MCSKNFLPGRHPIYLPSRQDVEETTFGFALQLLAGRVPDVPWKIEQDDRTGGGIICVTIVETNDPRAGLRTVC